MRVHRSPLMTAMLMLVLPILPLGCSGSGGDGFVVEVEVLVPDCGMYEHGTPSIDGDIVAWGVYDHDRINDTYELSVSWMDLRDRRVHDVPFDGYAMLPSVSDGKVLFIDTNTSMYVFDTMTGTIEKVRELVTYYPRLAGDVIYWMNQSGHGVDLLYMDNRTFRTIEVGGSDIFLSGSDLAYIALNGRRVEVVDIGTGARRTIWQVAGRAFDLYNSGDLLLWRMEDGEHSNRRIVLYDPERGTVNVTDPDRMDVGNMFVSGEYVAWAGGWNVENVSWNLFVYDIGSGEICEIFSNDTWEDAPVIYGDRILYFRNREDSFDLMMVRIVSSPEPPVEASERRTIGSYQGEVLALDLVLLVACLALALVPGGGRRTGSQRTRIISGPERPRGSSSRPGPTPRFRVLSGRPPR